MAEVAVRPVVVVVVLVRDEHGSGMSLVDDQDAVDEYVADVADEAVGIALARGACTGFETRTSMAVNTASNAAVNMAS